jgi:hypothetical protein
MGVMIVGFDRSKTIRGHKMPKGMRERMDKYNKMRNAERLDRLKKEAASCAPPST